MSPFIYSRIWFLDCTFSKKTTWRNKWKQDKFILSVSKLLPTVSNALWFASVHVPRQEQLKGSFDGVISKHTITFQGKLSVQHSSRCFMLPYVASSISIFCEYHYLCVTCVCPAWESVRDSKQMLFFVCSLPFGATSTCLSLLFSKHEYSWWKVLQRDVSDSPKNCAFYIT